MSRVVLRTFGLARALVVIPRVDTRTSGQHRTRVAPRSRVALRYAKWPSQKIAMKNRAPPLCNEKPYPHWPAQRQISAILESRRAISRLRCDPHACTRDAAPYAPQNVASALPGRSGCHLCALCHPLVHVSRRAPSPLSTASERLAPSCCRRRAPAAARRRRRAYRVPQTAQRSAVRSPRAALK